MVGGFILFYLPSPADDELRDWGRFAMINSRRVPGNSAPATIMSLVLLLYENFRGDRRNGKIIMEFHRVPDTTDIWYVKIQAATTDYADW